MEHETAVTNNLAELAKYDLKSIQSLADELTLYAKNNSVFH